MSEFSEAQKEYLDSLFLKLNLSINNKFAEVTDQISEIKEEISETTKVYENKIQKLTDENNQLQKEIEFLQRKVRKNNIVVHGIDLDRTDDKLCEGVVNILNQHLGINLDILDINDLYRLGKNKNKQPIVVEFITYQKKKLLLQNVKKLRGTNIFIAEDQSWEDRQKTKTLVKYLNKYRTRGKKAIIRGNKLIVEGQAYSIEELLNNDLDIEGEEENDVVNTAPTIVSREDLPVAGSVSVKLLSQKTKPDEMKSSKTKTDSSQKKYLRSTTASSKK